MNCYVTIIFILTIGHLTAALRITPPKKLGPGETRVQDPGWNHCVNNMKAKWPWQRIRNDGYPKFGGIQLQCSWILEAPVGWKVKIAFQDLDMAAPLGKYCRAQYVEIVDVGTGKSQGRFCGRKPPGDYVSAGSILRIDLQGDKSRGVYRGFAIRFKFVNERPGFRDQKTFYTTLSTSPGKANVNNFLSQQQRRLSAQRKPGPRPPGKFVYASDRISLPSTQPPPDSGWQGDDGGRSAVTTRKSRTRIPSGAKIPARVVPTPKVGNGNRIFAIHHRTEPTTSSEPDDGWQELPSINNQPRFYGEHNQPPIPTDDVTTAQTAVSSGQISTTHLIIIVVALISCFVIIAAIYFVKRIYFDKLKEEKKAKRIEMQSDFDRVQSLPGLSRSGSMHSMRSVGESLRHSSYRNTPLPPIPHQMSMTSLPPTSRRHHRSTTFSPDPIYSNERSMTLQPSHVAQNRHNHRRDVTFQRPLQQVSKDDEIDEDYCSGSDAEGDVTTLRRVYSKWEMEEKKRRKK